MSHADKYREAIQQAKREGRFEQWFNLSADLDAVNRTAKVDFLTIYEPVKHLLPGHELAVEIGHGGGRLLREAAKRFDRVVGVDLHEEACDVPSNVQTLVGSGDTIPIEDDSADLVYSMIVLHHLERFEDFVNYLHETARVLRPDGIARLFYFANEGEESYRTIKGKGANHVSLLVREDVAIELAKLSGFEVIANGKTAGRQSFLTLRIG